MNLTNVHRRLSEYNLGGIWGQNLPVWWGIPTCVVFWVLENNQPPCPWKETGESTWLSVPGPEKPGPFWTQASQEHQCLCLACDPESSPCLMGERGLFPKTFRLGAAYQFHMVLGLVPCLLWKEKWTPELGHSSQPLFFICPRQHKPKEDIRTQLG